MAIIRLLLSLWLRLIWPVHFGWDGMHYLAGSMTGECGSGLTKSGQRLVVDPVPILEPTPVTSGLKPGTGHSFPAEAQRRHNIGLKDPGAVSEAHWRGQSPRVK